MRTFQNTFKLIIIILLFNSCSSFVFPELKVINCTCKDDYFLVEFSAAPDLTAINKSLTLTKDDYKEDFKIQQQGNKLYIYPENLIKQNRIYHLIISTEAEDTNGNSLSSNFEWNFSTKLSNVRPEILSTDIQSTSISFNFNTQIKRNSFISSFSISPSVKYHTYFQDDDETASIIFEEPLKNNERYFLKLTTELENIYNNKLLKEYTDSFINNPSNEQTTCKLLYNHDNSTFELSSSAANNNLLSKACFTLQFSNQIETGNINSCLTFIPPLDYSITKNTETFSDVTIKLNEKPDPITEYTLTVSDKITDIYQNKLQSSSYKLIFDNPSETQPVFICAIIKQNTSTTDDTTVISLDSNYQNIYFDAISYPTAAVGPDTFADIIFIFEISPDADSIDYYSAIENIQISSTLNCIEITPIELTILSNSETLSDYLTLLPSHTQNLSAVKFHCKIKNYDNSGLINISINQNLSDNLKNTLSSTVKLTLNKR